MSKRIIVGLIICLSLDSANAQKYGSPKSILLAGSHEIGVNFFSANHYSFKPQNTFWFPGIFYRRDFLSNVLRASIEHRSYDRKPAAVVNPNVQSVQFTGHTNRIDFRIGYERLFLWRSWNIEPYLFTELGARVNLSKGTEPRLDTTNSIVTIPMEYRTIGLGVTTGAGLRWRFYNRFYLVAETDIFWFWSRRKNTLTGSKGDLFSDIEFNHIRALGISWLF